MLNLQQFVSAYQQLAPADKMKIDSSYIPDAVRVVLGDSAPREIINSFVKVVAFRVLNLIDDNAALQELAALNIQNAAPSYQGIVSALASTPVPLPGDVPEVVPDEEIAEMEAVLERIPPVRTMATDMQIVREQGSGEYRSSQDALLQRAATNQTAEAPRPDPDEARWNSTNNY